MSTMMKNYSTKFVAALIIIAMVLTAIGISTTTVDAAAKAPTKITLKATYLKVDVNGKTTVSVNKVTPAKASKDVTWKSSNTKVATVNKNGVVTGKKWGTVKITATSKVDKKVKATIKIKVRNLKPTGVTVKKPNVTLAREGVTWQLTPKVKTANVYNKGFTYSSSDETVAIVTAKGKIVAKTPGTATITIKSKEVNKTAKVKVTVKGDQVLEPWVMTGYYSATKLNNKAVDKDAVAKLWNSKTKTFDNVKKIRANIIGRYVQLIDTDGDASADYIYIVKRVDSEKYWDADMAWLDGVASEENNPWQPIDDETGWAMYDVEYRIPMGERQLANWGLKDWSGTTDWAVYEDSPYWENTDYDYYNLTSSDTLTMLTGYKTSLQETGSTCVMNSALTVLEWYGQRADLNAKDLSSLRSADRGTTGGTSIWELETVFEKLGELGITGEWEMEGWTDDNDILSSGDPTWLKEQLAAGHPVIVIWNSYGAHGQVIIGYDDMGTPETNDDVLIMMDPYDTTDHNPDGYIIQSYERLIWGKLTWGGETTFTKCLAVWPADGWTYEPTVGEGMALDKSNTGNVDGTAAADWENGKLILDAAFAEIDGMKIPYDTTAADLQAYYDAADVTGVYPYLDTGLSGAAGVERSGDVAYSPYYQNDDFYGTTEEVQKAVGSDTLDIIENFSTIQQSTEFSCGVTSAYMAMYHYGMVPTDADGKLLESDASLSAIRQIDEETGLGEAGATYVEGLDEVFQYMADTYDQTWAVASDQDYTYDEDGYAVLGDKYLDGELIQYLVANDVPMIIGWDEWGGHWQVVIGYDDMGTEATQDDVVILADSYDTTDHNQNGYVIESYERLIYGWNSEFETWNDEATGYEDDMYYAMYIAVPDTEEYADVINTLGLKTIEPAKDVITPWVLNGYYAKDKLNNTPVAEDAVVEIWDKNTGEFVAAENKEEVILGNYIQLCDENDDDVADLIQVVNFVDGKMMWDKDMVWLDGVASEETNPDQPIDDETGWAMFDVEYRIPMGERQLANWGLKDWSGTTDWAVYEDSPYWENTDYDYYNLTSSDTLTMLTGYKTSLQETGSTCVMNSALTVLEWYGQRADLNAKDLSSLRSADRGTTGGTSIWELETVFEKLGELGITGEWEMEGWTDDNDILSSGDPTWLKEQLAAGHPVIVIWNSYGAHGQVIIGYDDMGTPETNDDVLIMMDPYDTTDHNPDGYIIQSYERLIWGRLSWKGEYSYTKCLAVWPAEGWDYTATTGEGMPLDKSNVGNVDGTAAADWDNGKLILDAAFTEIDGMKIPYDTTAADLQAYYDAADVTGVYAYLDTGLSGAAGVERSGDVAYSPYYQNDDFYGTTEEVQKAVGSDTLDIIENFSTIQQSTEFSCGVTSAYMAMYHYGMVPTDADGKLLESDASLSAIRQIDEETGLGEAGATYVEGLDEVFQYMADTYDQTWAVASDQDYTYDEDGYAVLGDKYLDGELIQYLVANDVPMIIGWDEWGGHWQVVIGYDDMGTEATQDDVVILADSYDTTDHNQNGYVIESFERLLYGWNSEFEAWNDEATGYEDDQYYAMYIAVPDTDEYADVIETLGLH